MSAVITISAVNAGTDTLTAVAHGLTTGDRFRVRNSTGGALPTGLSPVTDMWAIRVDNDNLKAASSSANALAGTAIDITGAGSGTNLVEYGVPYCRRQTCAPGSQVMSVNLNELQDAVIAVHDLFTGQTQSVWTDIVMPVNMNVAVSGTGKFKRGTRVRHIPIGLGFQAAGAAMTINTTDDAMTTTNVNNVWRIPIQLDEGERITLVQGRVQMNNAGSTSRMKVYKDDLSGSTPSRSQLGSTATSAGTTNVLETLSSGAITEAIGSTFFQYFMEYDLTAVAGSPSNLFGIFVTTDIP